MNKESEIGWGLHCQKADMELEMSTDDNSVVTIVKEMTSNVIKGFEHMDSATIRVILDDDNSIYFKNNGKRICIYFVKSAVVMVNNE